MSEFRRILVAVLTALVLATGGLAQKDKNDNRPPKKDTRIVDKEKGNKPPPNNNNGQHNDNRKGKPNR